MKQIISFISIICCISLFSCTAYDIESIENVTTQKPYIDSICTEVDDIDSEYVSVRLDIELNIAADYCMAVISSPSKTSREWFDYNNNSVYCELLHSDYTIDSGNKTKSAELSVSILDKNNIVLDTETVVVTIPK